MARSTPRARSGWRKTALKTKSCGFGIIREPTVGARRDEGSSTVASRVVSRSWQHDALRELYKQPIVRDVQSLRRDPHEREATCAMHLDDYCLSTLPPDLSMCRVE